MALIESLDVNVNISFDFSSVAHEKQFTFHLLRFPLTEDKSALLEVVHLYVNIV